MRRQCRFQCPALSWSNRPRASSKAELDRFCDAMTAIRQEIQAVAEGRADRVDNPLKNAPHTATAVAADAWPTSYPREHAAFPLPFVRENKFWPSVARVDDVHGDRNLMCSCPPTAAYAADVKVRRENSEGQPPQPF